MSKKNTFFRAITAALAASLIVFHFSVQWMSILLHACQKYTAARLSEIHHEASEFRCP